jgi:hypothetical protein
MDDEPESLHNLAQAGAHGKIQREGVASLKTPLKAVRQFPCRGTERIEFAVL